MIKERQPHTTKCQLTHRDRKQKCLYNAMICSGGLPINYRILQLIKHAERWPSHQGLSWISSLYLSLTNTGANAYWYWRDCYCWMGSIGNFSKNLNHTTTWMITQNRDGPSHSRLPIRRSRPSSDVSVGILHPIMVIGLRNVSPLGW